MSVDREGVARDSPARETEKPIPASKGDLKFDLSPGAKFAAARKAEEDGN